MAPRRILSLWFPRLAAERARRIRREALPGPLAVVGERGGAQVLTSLTAEAEGEGLFRGQPLRDAGAMCPALLTHPEEAEGEAAFLAALRRWAGKFSPWVAEEPPEALVIDLSGCAHLFGGEEALLEVATGDCAALGLTVRAGIADTIGGAWALARHGTGRGGGAGPARSGDAIEQEARATRSRAAVRRRRPPGAGEARAATAIAPSGHLHEVLGPLPLTALRLPAETVEGLSRLGLRRVADLAGMPRAGLARRFGADTLRRLDQALGLVPEPVSAAAAPPVFAVRLSFPDPIGLPADIEAGMDRLLPALCARLAARGRGARRVVLQALRTDGRVEAVEVGLARATDRVERIRPLLALKLDRIDPGFGIDRLRLTAPLTEPVAAVQHRGPLVGGPAPATPGAQAAGALEDLIGRMGARLGAEAVTRLHPADSHIPGKTATVMAAAWSEPSPAPWPAPHGPRPLQFFAPEPVGAPAEPTPPATFRWRRRDLVTRVAVGPERILPEWWLDDPAWRSGPRDYWRIEVQGGERLWLFYAHGGEVSGGWFAQGRFA
jgi:protein ImuB